MKCGSTVGKFFETDTGGPQGDSSSAKNFTFYLAKALDQDQPATSNQPEEMDDITLELQYADDISKISTDKENIEQTLQELPHKLAERSLIINQDKTEQYEISKTSSDKWKKCKLLGTYLDTTEEIKRRKGLAIDAAKNLKKLFQSKKIWTRTKARMFDAYVSSVFLYNASTWTMTQTQETQIDAFQRRMIRINVLNIRWPKKVSNENVYRISGITPWSRKIKKQRIAWFGHLSRMAPNTPAKKALSFTKGYFQRVRGRPKTRWIDMMSKQLEEDFDLSWEQGETMALNRKTWRQLINQKYP